MIIWYKKIIIKGLKTVLASKDIIGGSSLIEGGRWCLKPLNPRGCFGYIKTLGDLGKDFELLFSNLGKFARDPGTTGKPTVIILSPVSVLPIFRLNMMK